MEQRVRLGRLFDAYGCLLTEKQQKCLELYFCDDLSLAEIADELEVSRQAIHDLIKRVEHTLERYESKLALLARDDHDKKLLEERAGCWLTTLPKAVARQNFNKYAAF